MHRPEFPKYPLRAVVVFLAVLFAAAVTPLAAQQAPDPANVGGSGAVQSSPAGTIRAQIGEAGSMAGPRLAPPFQGFEPTLPGTAAENESRAVSGGQHTIVISTLALVLAVVIIVLLATN